MGDDAAEKVALVDGDIQYCEYRGEHQLQGIIDLISVDLSEPYSYAAQMLDPRAIAAGSD